MLYGTIINGICIIIGSIAGLFLTNIPERYKETIMQGISLTVIFIGIQMALETNSVLIVLLGILTGAIVGEFLRLEKVLDHIGAWIAGKFKNKNDSVNVSQGFITASLIFGVGAMAILGALDSGLRGDHEILLMKAVLDGFTSFVLATTLGIGVMFSFIPVVLFQTIVTLLATQIEGVIPAALFEELLAEITAVGGLLIIAIGLNLLKVTKIRVTNLLPSICTVCIILYIAHLF